MLQIGLAAIHLLALAVGLPSVLGRARALHRPMVKLIRWRIAVGRGAAAEAVAMPETARRIATVSYVQAALVVLMVFFAEAMARGLGAMPGG